MQYPFFRQFFDRGTWTYTYLLADPESKEGILIDPVLEQVGRDLQFIQELDVRLKYTLETHTHADHITGATKIAQATGAKKVVGKHSGAECADLFMDDGDTLQFGGFQVQALSTPGHTDSCTSYLVGDKVFTGDALFIRGTGRTDFQQGSADRLYDSIYQKIFTLPEHTQIYPAHDYRGAAVSTVAEEKSYNPRVKLGTTKEQFVEIMNNLKLSQPERIHEAVPANLRCGDIGQRDF